MKCFICKYYKRYGYGAFDEYAYVTFANTATEALGLCLEQEGMTAANDWDISEIAQTVGANFIYSQND